MIRAFLLWLLRKTRPPYECYWRDRAFRAEAALRKVMSVPDNRPHGAIVRLPFWLEAEIAKVLKKAK